MVELWVGDRFRLELLPGDQAKRYNGFLRPEACGDVFGPPLALGR